MKLLYALALGLWCLAGCKKEESNSSLIDAAFNQQLTLRLQQSAALPNKSAPELTITVDKINDGRCRQGVNCVLAGYVETILSVQGQSGASQSVALRLDAPSSGRDSAVVQANGRQYTMVLHEVTPYPDFKDTTNPDKRVVLTVKRR